MRLQNTTTSVMGPHDWRSMRRVGETMFRAWVDAKRNGGRIDQLRNIAAYYEAFGYWAGMLTTRNQE